MTAWAVVAEPEKKSRIISLLLVWILARNLISEDGFGKEEQKRLAKVFKELSDRGCYVMLSNHNTTLVNELYKDFNIYIIEAKRNINANGKKRGKVEEVIITNFENNKGF